MRRVLAWTDDLLTAAAVAPLAGYRLQPLPMRAPGDALAAEVDAASSWLVVPEPAAVDASPWLGVLAAGPGVVTEIAARERERRIVGVSLAAKRVAGLAAGGRSVVFTNGVFDLLHRGHLRSLAAAAAEGDVLVVGLNSDESAARLKPDRPVLPEQARAELLAACRWVDLVVIFDEPTPVELIRAVRPQVLVKGGDYRPGEVVGAGLVTAAGGRVVTTSYLSGASATGLLEQLRARERA